jgi:hypothetical protein
MGSLGPKNKVKPSIVNTESVSDSALESVEQIHIVQKPYFEVIDVTETVEKPVFEVKQGVPVQVERPVFKIVDRTYKVPAPDLNFSGVQEQIQALTAKLLEMNNVIINHPVTEVKVVEVERMPMGLILFIVGLFLVNCIFLGGILAHVYN